jgi:hypothetical protein
MWVGGGIETVGEDVFEVEGKERKDAVEGGEDAPRGRH